MQNKKNSKKQIDKMLDIGTKSYIEDGYTFEMHSRGLDTFAYTPPTSGNPVTITIEKNTLQYRGKEIKKWGRGFAYKGWAYPKWEMVTDVIDMEFIKQN